MKTSNTTLLIVIIVVLFGLGLWAGMLILTIDEKSPNTLLVHLGQAGATLAIVTVFGALVQRGFIERDRDEDRREKDRHETRRKEEARIEFIRNILADFKSVYDHVESCRLLVEAHRSAKTYGEQMRQLVNGVVTLHNIKRALDPEFPQLKDGLKEPIKEMTSFIKKLLEEFQINYSEISRLQEADEAWNKYQRDTLPSKNESPSKYDPVSRAWEKIETLPHLSALREDKRFEEYKSGFLNHLDSASATLRKLIPVGEIIMRDNAKISA